MASIAERTEQLNRLLRGELSAIETYRQALDKANAYRGVADLKRIEGEHRDAATTLRNYIVERGGQPEVSSGVWGAWAKLVTSAATLFGDSAALKILKEGEEHGVKNYEAALADENLDAECRQLINAMMIPRQLTHIETLDRLMAAPTS